ncbi:hypothetical protein ACE6H2_013846 [Prunus campanulata]
MPACWFWTMLVESRISICKTDEIKALNETSLNGYVVFCLQFLYSVYIIARFINSQNSFHI